MLKYARIVDAPQRELKNAVINYCVIHRNSHQTGSRLQSLHRLYQKWNNAKSCSKEWKRKTKFETEWTIWVKLFQKQIAFSLPFKLSTPTHYGAVPRSETTVTNIVIKILFPAFTFIAIQHERIVKVRKGTVPPATSGDIHHRHLPTLFRFSGRFPYSCREWLGWDGVHPALFLELARKSRNYCWQCFSSNDSSETIKGHRILLGRCSTDNEAIVFIVQLRTVGINLLWECSNFKAFSTGSLRLVDRNY